MRLRRDQLSLLLLLFGQTLPRSLLLTMDPCKMADQRRNNWIYHMVGPQEEDWSNLVGLIWDLDNWGSALNPGSYRPWYLSDHLHDTAPNIHGCSYSNLPLLLLFNLLLRQGRRSQWKRSFPWPHHFSRLYRFLTRPPQQLCEPSCRPQWMGIQPPFVLRETTVNCCT